MIHMEVDADGDGNIPLSEFIAMGENETGVLYGMIQGALPAQADDEEEDEVPTLARDPVHVEIRTGIVAFMDQKGMLSTEKSNILLSYHLFVHHRGDAKAAFKELSSVDSIHIDTSSIEAVIEELAGQAMPAYAAKIHEFIRSSTNSSIVTQAHYNEWAKAEDRALREEALEAAMSSRQALDPERYCYQLIEKVESGSQQLSKPVKSVRSGANSPFFVFKHPHAPFLMQQCSLLVRCHPIADAARLSQAIMNIHLSSDFPDAEKEAYILCYIHAALGDAFEKILGFTEDDREWPANGWCVPFLKKCIGL